MAYYWFIIALPWIRSVSLQYISDGGQSTNDISNVNKASELQYPLSNSDYYDINNAEIEDTIDLGKQEDFIPRQSTTPPVTANSEQKKSHLNADRMVYLRSDGQLGAVPYAFQSIERYIGASGNYSEDEIELAEKRSFSPWGGKRDSPAHEEDNMSTWKRTANIREPSMPKRVRFNPWGGKRSSQVILKSGLKGSRIIFLNSFPEITRVLAALKKRGSIPQFEKRRPVNIWTLSFRTNDGIYNRDKLPTRSYMESTKFYKTSNPFNAILLKNDRKRKVKFNAWGGKTAPPVIGPIWNPINHELRDNTVDKIFSETDLDEATTAY